MASTQAALAAPDLTQRPPRSARVRLGGYVILPRMLDKGRAQLVGRNGEYHFNCPLDRHFLDFAGVNPDALLKQLAAGKGDGEILAWIGKHAKQKHSVIEVSAWSAYHENRGPADFESREYFNHKYLEKLAPARTDILSWFDVLDVDDHVSFGGKA
ncbi:MAG: DUF5069 domain-containing protein [Verrucomicrobia bacterium]|nr:DUF5069 domain-containing protein [Verrucomicrobiota bacterium]